MARSLGRGVASTFAACAYGIPYSSIFTNFHKEFHTLLCTPRSQVRLEHTPHCLRLYMALGDQTLPEFRELCRFGQRREMQPHSYHVPYGIPCCST